MRVEGPENESTLEAGRIIIAVGTKPALSDRVPINGRTIINSDQIMDLPKLPRTLIVVGGGVIGVEYACMFAVLGVRVTLIEKRNRLLEFADQEIIETLSYHLRDSRVTMRLGEEWRAWKSCPTAPSSPTCRARRRSPATRCSTPSAARAMSTT
jgi:NAD(P) transhydrogenase